MPKKRKIILQSDITTFLLKTDENKGNVDQLDSTSHENINEVMQSILKLFENRTRIPKSAIYEWSRKQKISPVKLYKALQLLLKNKIIIRRFDDELEEMAYILNSKSQ